MISQRTLNLKASPTLALAARAKELQSQGRDIVSLSVGEPDWATFDVVTEAGINAIRSGFTKYTPANGLVELRQAVAEQVSGDLGLKYSANQVTVTSGAKFTIFSALQSLLDLDDEVIIPSPFWVSYPTMVELSGGKPVVVETQVNNRFCLSPTELESAITSRTKILMLNSPSNPTGELYSRDELEALARVLRKHPRIVVLSDDIYNRLVFDGSGLAPHLLHVAPDLVNRTVLVNGGSKSYSMTGWRIGWALGPDLVIKAMTNYQSQALGCAASFTQKAACAAVLKGEPELRRAVSELISRRDYAIERLRIIKGIEVAVPGGAFYAWPSIQSWIGSSFRGRHLAGSADISAALLEEVGVAVVPGVEFGTEGYIRLSFALDRPSMTRAFDRIQAFADSLDRKP